MRTTSATLALSFVSLAAIGEMEDAATLRFPSKLDGRVDVNALPSLYARHLPTVVIGLVPCTTGL